MVEFDNNTPATNDVENNESPMVFNKEKIDHLTAIYENLQKDSIETIAKAKFDKLLIDMVHGRIKLKMN